MRKIYFIFLFLCCSGVFAQEEIENTKKMDKATLKLYPNPAYGNEVFVTTNSDSEKIIKVFDVLGELVLVDRLLGNRLNISKLNPGIYVLQLHNSDEILTRKLVIK